MRIVLILGIARMNTKSQYKTKQHEELLAFLESMKGTHITVHAVCSYFKSHGKAIGTATVYRRLEHMVEEGIVNKYIIDANSPACFEYTGGKKRNGAEPYFHCKCKDCGKLIHVRCSKFSAMQSHLLASHGFKIDSYRTVLYGTCGECSGRNPARCSAGKRNVCRD